VASAQQMKLTIESEYGSLIRNGESSAIGRFIIQYQLAWNARWMPAQ